MSAPKRAPRPVWQGTRYRVTGPDAQGWYRIETRDRWPGMRRARWTYVALQRYRDEAIEYARSCDQYLASPDDAQ